MYNSSVAVRPILSSNGLPVSAFSVGLALESSAGESPARSSRYISEQSGHNPVAGHDEPPPGAFAGVAVETGVCCGGVSGFEHAAITTTRGVQSIAATR